MAKDTLDPGDIARRLPDYRLLHELAHGGMGVVYLAEETALDRRVAVKVLSPPQTDDDEFRRRFLRESKMAAALDHPNVIPIYRAEDSDGLLYIVMRYVDGPDLDTLLRDEGPLGLERAIAVLWQAAAALDAAHAAGLIHRDVKPANILLDRASGHVYLVDFGIAKRLSADSAITTVGDFVGTLPYAAPEQIEGRPVDGRADVYALGCVLHRCLTGALPYPQNETAALMWAHLHQAPPRATDRRPDLPAAVDAVIATALAKEPQDRYPTCAGMIAALQAAAEDAPSDARAASPVPLPVVPPPPDPSIASPGEPEGEFPLLGGPRRAVRTRRLLKAGAPLAAALALLAVLVAVLWPNAGTGIGPALALGEITTVAGKTLLSGDGGPATGAALDNPIGIAVDAAGSLYIAEGSSHRIRRIDPDGTITTVAGTGKPGFSGDGGPAANARLNSPRGVAADAAGNLYIADFYNDRVRKVNSEGVITTIAGIDARGFFGDGGPAANAALNTPFGIAVDAASRVYIAEAGSHRIRRIDPDGTITTVAGTGEPGFSGDGGPAANAALNTPKGIAVDAAGRLYIADWGNYRVRRVDPDGVITTVAGTVEPGFSGDGGPATNARLNGVTGVGVGATGSLYLAEAGNHLVRRVNPGGVITSVAGSGQRGSSGDDGPAVNGALDTPQGVALDAAGSLYFTEWGSDRVRRVNPDGLITTIAGAPRGPDQGEAATEAVLNDPTDLAVDAAGRLYIADSESHRVRRIDRSGTITTVAGTGEPGFSGDGGPAVNARLSSPRGVAVDAAGNLYIADWGSYRIRKVNADGVITTIAGTGSYGFAGDGGPAVSAALNDPRGIAVDTAGSLYFADTGNHRVRRINPDGVITTITGTGEAASSGDGGPAANAALNAPIGIAFDTAGSMYIAEESGHRVRRIDPAGTITTVAGTGTYGFSGDGGPATDAALNTPESIAIDADGNLYVTEFNNQRVRRIDRDGIITTVAGDGQRGLAGDDGPAVNATLDLPLGIAVDAHGNLYISEWGNDRVRKVKLATDAAAGSG